jgi:hypothetical protein
MLRRAWLPAGVDSAVAWWHLRFSYYLSAHATRGIGLTAQHKLGYYLRRGLAAASIRALAVNSIELLVDEARSLPG